LFCLFFELQFLIALLSLVCFEEQTKQWQNRQGKKGQSEDVIQRTDKNNTMAKQTMDKRAIRSCNSKNGQKQYNGLFFELHLLIALLSLVCFAIVLSVL
jgi:hypothetical protein